jgi:hypothetical protein
MKYTRASNCESKVSSATPHLVLRLAGAWAIAFGAVCSAELPYRPIDVRPTHSPASKESAASSAEMALPTVPNFTLRNPFYSNFAEDAISVARGMYVSNKAEVEFSTRLYSNSERAIRALSEDVAGHLKNGGEISTREFGRTSTGEYIEVARCARNGVLWTHWVVGERKYVVATRDASEMGSFLSACTAWDASARVQWHGNAYAAYELAAKVNLPIFFYFFEHGGYCDDLERNALAGVEFNALRDRAVFIAFDPDKDDAAGNRAAKLKELNVTRVPTIVLVQIEPKGLVEKLRITGYFTPEKFNGILRGELDSLLPRRTGSPVVPAMPMRSLFGAPAANFPTRTDLRVGAFRQVGK